MKLRQNCNEGFFNVSYEELFYENLIAKFRNYRQTLQGASHTILYSLLADCL